MPRAAAGARAPKIPPMRSSTRPQRRQVETRVLLARALVGDEAEQRASRNAQEMRDLVDLLLLRHTRRDEHEGGLAVVRASVHEPERTDPELLPAGRRRAAARREAVRG